MMRVTHYDRQAEVFTVDELEEIEGYGVVRFRVNLRSRKCDCVRNQFSKYTASSSRSYLMSSFGLNGTERLFGLIRRCDDRNVVVRCQRESAMACILSSLLNLRGVVYAGKKVTPRRSVRTQHQRVEHKKFVGG
ncbi:hypothetical protein PIB30_059734 [Stylosanthes scabra]|uniref:Uncharacterized protein n=1 Tax=Stylosanthes scabra TaxID=79078 RepID=A0ABU6TKZ0_9FABA|nr:hypothetical protein [Stylosanthes scabra]